MAFINGPNIVQDSLIVCYDPQNPMSKVSTTTIDNTVSPQFQGTAQNTFSDPGVTPNYLNFRGGSNPFSTTADILYSGTNFPATTTYSLNFWIKHNGNQTDNFDRIFGTDGNIFEVAEDISNKIRIFEGAWQTSTVTINTVGWTNIVVINTVDPEIKIYQNGVLEDTITAGRSMTNVGWRLGGNGNSSASDQECWRGFLGYFSAYTKELSSPEVVQNYNALKSRFI